MKDVLTHHYSTVDPALVAAPIHKDLPDPDRTEVVLRQLDADWKGASSSALTWRSLPISSTVCDGCTS